MSPKILILYAGYVTRAQYQKNNFSTIFTMAYYWPFTSQQILPMSHNSWQPKVQALKQMTRTLALLLII